MSLTLWRDRQAEGTLATLVEQAELREAGFSPVRVFFSLLVLTKESACNEGELGLIPGLGRSPGEGNGYPLQYSCLENPMDKGA